ncbi:MAG: hypothetical protein ACOY7T_10195 [Pseudomonadota bacterium]
MVEVASNHLKGRQLNLLDPSAIDDEELWDRAMKATDVMLEGEHSSNPLLLCQHLISALCDMPLEKVAELDPGTFAELSGKAMKTVGHMLLHLAQVKAS